MFKGCHFLSNVILETVRYYLAYKLSYREIEEIQLECGVVVVHATIKRWIIKFAPVLERSIITYSVHLVMSCNSHTTDRLVITKS